MVHSILERVLPFGSALPHSLVALHCLLLRLGHWVWVQHIFVEEVKNLLLRGIRLLVEQLIEAVVFGWSFFRLGH